MRKLWILVASALLAFANFVKSQETARNLYSSRYDNLDIDTILGSTRLVNNYVDCLLSRKPCPPEGKDLKRILPEALRTKCGRCSTTQKENALKIITTLYFNYPDQYQALRERWDPTGEYHRRLEEYLRELQFNQIGSNGNGDRPVSTESTINLGNRFGFDNENGVPAPSGSSPPATTSRTTSTTTTTARTTAATRPTTTTTRRPPAMTRPPPTTRQTTTTPRTTTTRFGVGNGNNRSPIVGLFNQLGSKLANTADAIAGMFRKTVDVIVTSHLQAHQRAMRSYQ